MSDKRFESVEKVGSEKHRVSSVGFLRFDAVNFVWFLSLPLRVDRRLDYAYIHFVPTYGNRARSGREDVRDATSLATRSLTTYYTVCVIVFVDRKQHVSTVFARAERIEFFGQTNIHIYIYITARDDTLY